MQWAARALPSQPPQPRLSAWLRALGKRGSCHCGRHIFHAKEGWGELLLAWTGSHGRQASPCPLSQRPPGQGVAGLREKRGRRLPGWVRASVLASATRPAVAPGPRRGRWRWGCWLRPLRPAVNNGRRRQGEAPLLPPSLFRARGGGGADTRLPEAAAPGAGPRDGLLRQPRSPSSAGGAGGAAAGATGERLHFLPAAPVGRGNPGRPRPPPAPGALPWCPPLARNPGGGGGAAEP